MNELAFVSGVVLLTVRRNSKKYVPRKFHRYATHISTQMMTRIIIDVAKIRNYFEPMNRRAKFIIGFRNM